tara:strand:- start:420 stop:1646 length:1227 start_codon:yes stop_codon:yes gene_type:complete
MNENEIKEMIAKTANAIGMSDADALARFEDICSKNSVSVSEEPMLALNLWKEFYNSALRAQKKDSNTGTTRSSGGFYKSAFGFFASLDEARDMLARKNETMIADYRRDRDTSFSTGQVAVFTDVDGKYEGRLTKDGQELVKVVETLPANHVDMDDGTYVVPLDTNDAEWNKSRYGKPLAKSEWRRSGIFIGEVDGRMGKYFFNYKGDSTKDFTPKTFTFVHFECILNSNDNSKIHGGKSRTLESLVYNDELSTETQLPEYNVQDALMEYSEGNFSPIIDLDAAHSTVMDKDYNDRFVFTDGDVTTVNMNPTKNGNRYFVLADFNSEFSLDDDNLTCWTPPHIAIEFGIGSKVVVVGRTSQGTDEDGNLRPVSLNVNGILVTKARGGSPDEITHIEDDSDGFDDDWSPV